MSQPGARIGNRFVLRRPLGRGGMAEVWLAWDEQLQFDVALKLLAPQVALDEEGLNRFRTRFQREADAISRLDSPHIVRLIDFGDSHGELYMAISYINGKPLSAVLEQEGIQHPARVREIARQMATGLEVAHANGVLHRDLKPANVMLMRTAQGRDHAVLVDFGIAHMVRSVTGETLTRLTSEGSMIGTPRYLPPEYIRGDVFDERSDLFALGLIVYEMLEGHAAVGGQDTVQIIARHLDQRPFRLRPEIVERDPGLANIVHRLLEKNPNDRIQTPADLRQALLTGTVAPAPSKGHTVEQPIGQREDRETIDVPTIAAAIFILFVCVAAGFFLFGGGSDPVEAADVEPVIGESNDPTQVGDIDEEKVTGEIVSASVEEARYEIQMAVLDSKVAAKPRPEPSEETDAGNEGETEVAGEVTKGKGLKWKLPQTKTMDKVREVIPSLTIE